MFSAFRNCISLVDPIFSCWITYRFLAPVILKFKFNFNCLRRWRIHPLECGLKSIKIQAHYAAFNSKIIQISKLSSSTYLAHNFWNYGLPQSAGITILVSKQQFERPKWPFQTQDRHKLVHRSTAKGHERTPYQYYSLYLVILNQIFNLVQRFYHIFDFFFSSSGTKILLLSVCWLVPEVYGVYSIVAMCTI